MAQRIEVAYEQTSQEIKSMVEDLHLANGVVVDVYGRKYKPMTSQEIFLTKGGIDYAESIQEQFKTRYPGIYASVPANLGITTKYKITDDVSMVNLGSYYGFIDYKNKNIISMGQRPSQFTQFNTNHVGVDGFIRGRYLYIRARDASNVVYLAIFDIQNSYSYIGYITMPGMTYSDSICGMAIVTDVLFTTHITLNGATAYKITSDASGKITALTAIAGVTNPNAAGYTRGLWGYDGYLYVFAQGDTTGHNYYKYSVVNNGSSVTLTEVANGRGTGFYHNTGMSSIEIVVKDGVKVALVASGSSNNGIVASYNMDTMTSSVILKNTTGTKLLYDRDTYSVYVQSSTVTGYIFNGNYYERITAYTLGNNGTFSHGKNIHLPLQGVIANNTVTLTGQISIMNGTHMVINGVVYIVADSMLQHLEPCNIITGYKEVIE